MASFLDAVAGGLPVVGSVISTLINNHATDAANAANKQFAIEQQNSQNAFNQRMLEEQLNYNSPSATMQRLTNAGLNPNLVAGQVSGGYQSAPQISAKADYVATPHPATNFGEAAASSIRAFQDMRINDVQPNNISAQTVDAIASAALKGHQAGLADAQAKLAGSEADAIVGKLPHEVANIDASTNLLGHQASVADSEVAKNVADTNRINTMLSSDLAVNRATVNKLAADAKFTLGDNDRQWLMTQPNINALIARAANDAASAAKSQTEIKQINANTSLLYNDAALKQLDLSYRNAGGQVNPSWILGLYQTISAMVNGVNPSTGLPKAGVQHNPSPFTILKP